MEGVTPGEWILGPFDMVWHADDIEHHDGKWREKVPEPRIIASASKGNLLPYEDRANAAYIAACNPVAMREVLAIARQAEALQRENAELREQLENMTAFKDIHAMKRGEYSDRIIILEDKISELRTALEMISAETKESNEPIGRSVYKALATCGEIADLALLGGENAGN
ncbi:hypothetical protein [Shinella pollutisoli]|uniref:Ead/Ea22-like family protein n=1 Tax=Shinella pollutisoli TaxID=2250594 RepID=A0ABV7DCN7_9HYPH|nr:hypothetical protein [Shinella pollutisoli]